MERSTIFHGKTHYKWWFSIVMLVYQRVTLCANFFLGVEDWILLGFFHCFLYQKFHPIPNSPLKDMAIDCFLRPIRYSDTPISSQLWEQTSRCSWHADGWRPNPWMVLSRQRFARHGLLFLISQAWMMGKFREIRIPQLGVKDQPNTYGSYGFW